MTQLIFPRPPSRSQIKISEFNIRCNSHFDVGNPGKFKIQNLEFWLISMNSLHFEISLPPLPQPGLRAYKGTLRGPAAKIAPGQVAGNSNHFCGHLVKGRHRTP